MQSAFTKSGKFCTFKNKLHVDFPSNKENFVLHIKDTKSQQKIESDVHDLRHYFLTILLHRNGKGVNKFRLETLPQSRNRT